MKREDRIKRNEEIRRYVETHTFKEAEEHYGLCKEQIRYICHGIRPAGYGQFKSDDQIANVKRLILKANPEMEYVGGNGLHDGFVVIRHTVCGYTFKRSMSSIRHGLKTICPFCVQDKKLKQKQEVEDRKAKRHAEHLVNLEKQKEKQRQQTMERQEGRRHNCPVCGKSTTRPKFCSNVCGSKFHFDSSAHEQRRRTRIRAKYIDKDITLKKLYDRDNGRCWICGLACDYQDSEQTENAFIAGNLYPSIDHVIALSNGGQHSWDNVKLAHRICNSVRYWDSLGSTKS